MFLLIPISKAACYIGWTLSSSPFEQSSLHTSNLRVAVFTAKALLRVFPPRLKEGKEKRHREIKDVIETDS